MKIALFLSSDSIALAHRQPDGHWAMIGDTAFDVPDVNAAMADLRDLAVAREGDAFETLLVLPDDQILYTSLTAPTDDPELTIFRIEDGLDGLTPYAVTELEYDWRVLEQDRVKIAVVARETLDEARNFAAQYGFACTGFASMPPMERFPGVPTFELGARASEMGFSAEGIAFGADMFEAGGDAPNADASATADVEPEAESSHVEPEAEVEGEGEGEPVVEFEAAEPAAAGEEEPYPQPELEPEPERQSEPPFDQLEEPEPAPSYDDAAINAEAEAPFADPFTDETAARAQEYADAPYVAGQAWDEVAPIEPELVPEEELYENGALAEALMAAAAAQEAAEAEWDEHVPSIQAIEDPSLSGPVAPLEPEVPDFDVDLPQPPQDVIGDAGDDDFILPPPPSPAAIEARQRARVIRGEGPGAVQNPAADSSQGSMFTAKRGPVEAPTGPRGSLVGQRETRFGLAHPDDAGSEAPPQASAQQAPIIAANGPMPRLAEQLQRVRSASRTRPKSAPKEAAPPRARVEIDTKPALGQTGVLAERRPSPFDDHPPSGSEANADGGSRGGSLAGLLGRRGKFAGADKPAKPEGATRGGFMRRGGGKAVAGGTSASVAKNEAFASGLLARKATVPVGGSFRTGLILTAILLLLLVLVAIWSAVFLPDSALSRWLGMDGAEVAEAPAATGSQAPVVVSSAPLIGQPGGAQPTLEDEAAADGLDIAVDTRTAAAEVSATDVVVAAPQEAVEAAVEVLPDIDAEFDLPPLPPIDQRENPTLEEAETLYVEDGIWARSPDRPDLRPFDLMDRVYTASIDPVVSAFDAVALPDPGVNAGEVLRQFPPPPPFGAQFDVNAAGLIAPTADGVLTPEGAFIISGPPPIQAVPRPREVVTEVPVTTVEEAILGTFRPAERPGDLIETRERQLFGGFTETELGERRPEGRPASPQEVAARASLFPGDGAAPPPANGADEAEAEVVEIAALSISGTDLAIAQSPMPRTRPANIEQIVASAVRAPVEETTTVAAAVAPEAIAAGPAIPSNADVSRAATERDVIRLRNVNLIGVTGTPSDRRALVRLSSGRFVRVSVGDSLDGGRVAAIGETTLQYVRSGRTVTLEIPG